MMYRVIKKEKVQSIARNQEESHTKIASIKENERGFFY